MAASGPSSFGGNVTKYDAVTGGRLEGVELLACGIASGAVGVWLAGCPNAQELSSGGPGSGIRILGTVPLPYPEELSAANFRESLVGIATGDGSVWVLGTRPISASGASNRRVVASSTPSSSGSPRRASPSAKGACG